METNVEIDTNEPENPVEPSPEESGVDSILKSRSVDDISPDKMVETSDTTIDFPMDDDKEPVDQIESHNDIDEPVLHSNEIVIPSTSFSLSLLAQYGTDSETEQSDDDVEGTGEKGPVDGKATTTNLMDIHIEKGNYRTVSSEDSTSDSDSDVEYVGKLSALQRIIECDDDEDEDGIRSRRPAKTKGEFDIDDLPPIEDLNISVPEQDCIVLGQVISIVDQLVMVDSLPGKIPLDIDTVLFLDNGSKPLGKIFDVVGNINNPMYCVRFNSSQQIRDKGITVGQIVYVAPNTDHTHYVILSELMKFKATDSSWENDNETPADLIEYSDDEEEARARAKNRKSDRVQYDRGGKRQRQPMVFEAPVAGPSNYRDRSINRPYARQSYPQARYQQQYQHFQATGPYTFNDYANYSWHSNYQFGNDPYNNPLIFTGNPQQPEQPNYPQNQPLN